MPSRLWKHSKGLIIRNAFCSHLLSNVVETLHDCDCHCLITLLFLFVLFVVFAMKTL